MPFNRAVFFDFIRETPLFGGVLLQHQVSNMDKILDACADQGLLGGGLKQAHPDFAGYIFGTTYGEVGTNMSPVREGFKLSDAESVDYVRKMFEVGTIRRNYGAVQANGQAYFGRGYVQLTHPENYRKLGDRLDLPLWEHPALALSPDIAAAILVIGMKEGLFTGVEMSDYLPHDMVGARRVVNAMDRASRFAHFGHIFAEAIRLGMLVPAKEKPYLSWWGRVWRFIKNLFLGEIR